MGRGRILNNSIRQYGINIYEPPEITRKIKRYPDERSKMYRTHNIAYPDLLEEGGTKQFPPDNVFVSQPMPPADNIEFTYAEPSNIVTDAIIYEQGTADIPEDMRLTVSLPRRSRLSRRLPGGIDAGGSNTIFTTEYNTGINEKVRRDNPAIVIDEKVNGTGVKKIARLKPLPSSTGRRRFNVDYDKEGKPLQPESPVYENIDYLKDLHLTSEDFGYGETISRISDESLSVFEDFLTKGRIREGWEIIPSDDF